jgi:hypothetical protein
MNYYKKILQRKKALTIAGAKGEKPSYLMPPSSAFGKVGFQIYEALDLLCEGPIAGLTDKEGVILDPGQVIKNFSSKDNTVGSSKGGIDKAIYFDNIPLRESNNEPTVSKYNCVFRDGSEFQTRSEILATPQKLQKYGKPIKGPWININGARNGSGSLDTRGDRDFVNWQNYIPREVLESPFYYENYDKNVNLLNIGLQIDGLFDTKSFADKYESSGGKSRLGTNLPITVSIEVTVGKINDLGEEEEVSFASFTTRAGKGVTLGNANGRISITGIITAPYTFTLENITLPNLSDTDINNFVRIRKIEAETSSSIVKREIGVGTVSEINAETYLYPNSAYVGTSIDSKYFPQVPSRTFKLKGKKVLIPSNYHPVDDRLFDRRFSDDGSSAGRVIYGDLVFNNAGDGVSIDDVEVIFLIDTSGSMSGNRLAWAKTAIIDALNFLVLEGMPVDSIAIVEYNSSSAIVANYGTSLSAMVTSVNSLTADGGTNMSSGLQLITNSLILDTTKKKYIFALSDGDVGSAAVDAQPLKNDGVTIATLGMDITPESSAGLALAAVATPGYTYWVSGEPEPGLIANIIGLFIINLRGIERSPNRNWDGTFKLGWTDNPAWIYYDLLINTRYGIGSYLRDVSVVDKWSLYEIGRYCDAVNDNGEFVGLSDGFGGLEPRFSCNIMIKDQNSAFEAIQDIARTFRAMAYFSNSFVNVRVDKPYFKQGKSAPGAPPSELEFAPHLIFNNLNVKGGAFAYADVDRNTKLSAVEVSFLDKSKNFTSATEYVEDTEAIKQVGLNFKQLDGIGVTSRGQAHRLAKYILFESLYTTETVSFGAGLEALLVEPGDIIRVDDEMRNFSKNFGTVVGTSGNVAYYNPNGSGDYEEGPAAILVEPAFKSNQFENLTGGVLNIFNPVGTSGTDQFDQFNGKIDQNLYKELNNPQAISLKINSGGSGFSYQHTDSGVYIFIDEQVTGTAVGGPGTASSQWFSNEDANDVFGSSYSVDISGREPKYYRILAIKEDVDMGYNITATIHHTGKFEFVEENTTFDINPDSFQPDLITTELIKPNPPSNLATGAFSQNLDASLNLPLNITDPSTRVGNKYVVYIEEPNTNVIVAEFGKSFTSVTNVILSGAAKIDQIGSYEINVFSESSTATTKIRSSLAATISFTTQSSDFNFNSATNSFLEYKDISINTAYESSFNNLENEGTGQVSFIENNELINATFNLSFEDIFGNEDAEVIQSISGQVINLKNYQGDLIETGFKVLGREEFFSVTNEELNIAFGYTGEGKYRIPPSLDFEVGSFLLSGSGDLTTDQFISFGQPFSESPAVFTSQLITGGFENDYDKIGRVISTSGGFYVTGSSSSISNHVYIATKTGNFKFNNSQDRIEVATATKDNNSGYNFVGFSEDFDSIPKVFIQSQQPQVSEENYFSETCITGVSVSGFYFNSFESDLSPASGTGIFAYLATNQNIFNVADSSDLPIRTLNYSCTGESNFNFNTDSILEQVNGTNNVGYRFNNDQYAVLYQRYGDDGLFENSFFAVQSTGDGKNKVSEHILQTGSGIGASGSIINADFPDHVYSLFNTNGDVNQLVIDGANDANVTGSFTSAQINNGELLTFASGGDVRVPKIYDHFGDKHAIQDITGIQAKIVTGGSMVSLDGKPALDFVRTAGGQDNAVYYRVSDSGHITGVEGLEIFATVSFDTVNQTLNASSSFRADYVVSENQNSAVNDIGFGAGKVAGTPYQYLYEEHGSANTFGGFDFPGDITKDGWGITGNEISFDTKYVLNGFVGFDDSATSGFRGMTFDGSYVSGYTVSGQKNNIIGTIGSDQTYDNSFDGKFQELLIYKNVQPDSREKIRKNALYRSNEGLTNPNFNFIQIGVTGIL